MWNPTRLMRSAFDEQLLVCANEEAVCHLKIPESSKSFLTLVGLPQGILLFEFALDVPCFPTVQDFACTQGMDVRTPSGLRRIGTDDLRQICLSEQDESGHVVGIDLKGRYPTRYVNRSVEHLGGFLAFYMMYCDASQRLTEDGLTDYARDLEAQMRHLDPLAFEAEHHWALITEQMKDGLL